jgi:glycosyltransferase involved in cell wall biosynthesis
MISIVYCTKEHNQKHIDHLKKIGGHPKVEVIEYINKGEGLTKFYNKGLKESKFDIVVFCHDDIIVESKQVARKLIRHYENNDHGILGVAGTKELSTTGRWWDNRKTMYGRVWHTHEGKKSLTKYSPSQDKRIEDVVIVDGVFFSVMKSRLKKKFSKYVKGFHFYDIDFCFNNFLKGVKVGVHTDISINHMSIGITNDEWEINRAEFAERFKDNLPVKIDRKFTGKEKFKILIGGDSILEVLPLAIKLSAIGHSVTITSQISDEAKLLRQKGIKFFPINEPLGFKMGDGKWALKGANGENIPSEPKKLYKIGIVDFDILHVNDGEVKNYLLRLYPEVACPNEFIGGTPIEEIIDEYKKVLV